MGELSLPASILSTPVKGERSWVTRDLRGVP